MLRDKDTVVFRYENEDYTYTVGNRFLSNNRGSVNNKIFNVLGISAKEKMKMAESAYGYTSSDGGWPPYKTDDWVGINRLVDDINRLIRRKEGTATAEQNLLFKKHMTNLQAPIELGDYVTTDYSNYPSKGMVFKVIKFHSSGNIIKVGESINWNTSYTRHATEKQILESEYADEYKSKFKTSSYEVQSEIKAVNSRHREEPIRPRRSTVKVTSSSGLIGNKISIRSRRGKVRTTQIKQTVFTISRS
tara:strand:+ start:2943 stop:3683 length:741 start_codon:yes stop_codon:yes gene_type:complete